MEKKESLEQDEKKDIIIKGVDLPGRERIKQLMYFDIEKELIRGLNNSYKFYTDTFGQEKEDFKPVHVTFMLMTSAANDFLREVKKRMIKPGADTIIEDASIESMEKSLLDATKKVNHSREMVKQAKAELADARNWLQEKTDLIDQLQSSISQLTDENGIKEKELVYLNKKAVNDTAMVLDLNHKIEELTRRMNNMLAKQIPIYQASENQEPVPVVDVPGTVAKAKLEVLLPPAGTETDSKTSVDEPVNLTMEPHAWNCSCGRVNSRKRCTSCGRSRIAAMNELSARK